MAKEKKVIDRSSETASKNLKSFFKKASDVKEPDFIPSGHFSLDLAIGKGISLEDSEGVDIDSLKGSFGGFPSGKLVEISGGEGSGKSSFCYRVTGIAQKAGLRVAWVDAEHSFSHSLAKINGVDLDSLDVADLIDEENPDHLYSAQEIFDRVCDACAAGYDIVILDSIANLATQAELDNEMAKGGVGIADLPRVLSTAMKKVTNYAAKFDTLVMMINQIREKPGVMFGNPEGTPGGRALKHAASIRLKVQKQTGKDGPITTETEKGSVVVGNWSYVYLLKNRFGEPVEGEIKIPIYYKLYFPESEDIIFNEGRRTKVITKYKEYFKWNGIALNKLSFIEKIKKDKLVGALVADIKVAAEEQGYVLPPEVNNYKDSLEPEDLQALVEAESTEDVSNVSKQPNSRRGKRSSSKGSEGDALEI